jgi:NADPH:quinone reductase-like Zn-dependent oxidoreductase
MLEYRTTSVSGVENMSFKNGRQKQLGKKDVRIGVRAASLNARDIGIVSGHYPLPAGRSVVPCSDGAGVVLEVGGDVIEVAVGDRVVGGFFRDWHLGHPDPIAVAVTYGAEADGWLTTEAVIDARALAKIPDAMSFADAATTPCAAVTAWSALFGNPQPKKGMLLVQGTGGVAIWALQFAAAAGISSIVTTSAAAKLKLGDTVAVHRVINYAETPEWSREVLKATDGQGVDLVLELGGKDTIGQSLKAVRMGGEIAVIGGLSGWAYPPLSALEIVMRQVSIRGVNVGSTAALKETLGFIEAHAIKPVVARTYKFSDAKNALQDFSKAKSAGKFVIEMA